jgi:hypothetical protein
MLRQAFRPGCPFWPGRPWVAATVALVAAVALAGCGSDDAQPQPSTSGSTQAETRPDTGTTTFAVFLARDERVAPVRRTVPHTPGVARAALTALLAGPSPDDRAAGYGSAIPAGTELLDVAIANGTATVDLSGAFAAGGGSSSMLTRIAQVVFTVTQFPGVERVAFRLDGRPVTEIGGEGVVVDPPVGRAGFEDQTPAILVESPLPGDTVRSPVRLRGTANVFEATVALEVRAADGTVVQRTFTTATSGSGTRGTFDTDLEVDVPAGPFVIVAFESSAKDGSKLFPVELPLTLER